jgi:hypothetical protein
MPITIKELLLSDVISEVVEKVNFNFDQLVLAGGGPPGIQGIQGLAGPIGPIGARGDHWFVGPTAFGQTADHDGTSLQIQDLFLDSDGNVYKYFEISGSTGWTYSGINLKGPSGTQGVTGGGLEWSIYKGTSGNAAGAYSYTPTTVIGTSTDTDFLIPNYLKDSIFLGDSSWAYNKLDNFGANIVSKNSWAGRSGRMPKLSIIQSEVNPYGMNGLLFGAYGATTSLIASSSYGTVGSTTSAFNFVNIGFATEFDNNDDGPDKYRTRFKLISPRASVKFEIGGIPTLSNQQEKRIASFETVASETIFKDWNGDKTISIEDNRAPQSPIKGNLREISLVSKQKLFAISGGGIYSNILSTTNSNQYGYIALQNDPGSMPSTTGWPEHAYGNVIIGPVRISTTNLGFVSPQGLGIVRKITKHDTVDAAIRFFQTEYVSGASTEEFRIKSTFGGAVTPVRIADSNLPSSPVLDTLAISSGLGYSIPGVTAAGRIGFTNNVLEAFKPQHAFHVSISKDAGTRNRGWDAGGAFIAGELDMFYAGFDNDPIPGSTGARNSGIGFASKSYRDVAGVTHSVPIIQTYYRLKTGWTPSVDYANDNISIGQGQYAPHLYIQPHDTSNIGIGFSPNPSVLGTGGTNGYWPLAKVAINGGVVIGSTAEGYHNVLADRQEYGLQLQSRIVVGTTSQTMAFSTPAASLSQVLDTNGTNGHYGIGKINISASFNQFVFGRFFLSHKSGENPGFPEFGFSDFRTGIRMGMDNASNSLDNRAAIGKGQLVSAANNSTMNYINGTPSGVNFPYPKVVAEWSSRGDNISATGSWNNPNGVAYNFPAIDYNNNFDYSTFKIMETFSEGPFEYLNFYELSKLFSAFSVNGNITNGSSTLNTNSTTLRFPGIYHKIPTRKSGVMLNIDYVYRSSDANAGKYHYIKQNGTLQELDIQVGGVGVERTWFLNGTVGPNGFSLSDNSAISTYGAKHRDATRTFPVPYDPGALINNWYDYTLTPIYTGNIVPSDSQRAKAAMEFNRRWPSNFATLEDGHYNGQRFTLYVLNVDTNNNLYLDATPPHPDLLSSSFNPNWQSSLGSFTSISPTDPRLISKTKIQMPYASDSNYIAPNTPWGSFFGEVNGNINNTNGVNLKQSSLEGTKLGAFLTNDTVYTFVWQFTDAGLYNNQGFEWRQFQSYPPNSAPNSSVPSNGIYFENLFNPNVNAAQSRRELGNTQIYKGDGTWICTSITKVNARNAFNYGSLGTLADKKYTNW